MNVKIQFSVIGVDQVAHILFVDVYSVVGMGFITPSTGRSSNTVRKPTCGDGNKGHRESQSYGDRKIEAVTAGILKGDVIGREIPTFSLVVLIICLNISFWS